METLNVSIVFPILNNLSDTLRCLNSIQNLNFPKNKLEVIIFDNGSTDNSEQIIKRKYPKTIIIKSTKNLGFAKAVNRTVKKTRGKYLFITNNDVVFDKNSLNNLVTFLINSPKVGIAGPKIYNLKNKKEILGRPLFYHFSFGTFSQGKVTQNPTPVDWVQGCGLCISKQLWNQLKGFDEGFFFTGEELDLCLRAKYLGYKVIYYPKATIWHGVGATISKPELKDFRYFQGYKSKFRLIIKHGKVYNLLSSLVLQLFIFAPYRLLILKEKSLIPLMKALLWNFKNIQLTLTLKRKMQLKST